MTGNKFLPSTRLKVQLEALLNELDKDTMREIAAGVSQLNVGVELVRTNMGIYPFRLR
jgi:hypothetical protein